MAKNVRVLIIGLDGGTWRVLKPMMNKGVMPNLKKLIESGVSGILNSTLPPLTPPAMASFQTGVLPSKHGIYEFTQYRPGSYRPTFVSSKSLKKKTIWRILSNAGAKIALVGVPLTYPPQPINGISVSGLLTPNLKADFVYPPAFKAELLKNIHDYRFHVSPCLFYTKGLKTFLKEIIYTETKRTEAFKFILSKLDWNIAMLYFQSVDGLQHTLWPMLQPQSREYSPEKFNQISAFFKLVDRTVGDLTTAAGEDMNVIVISDHGFGPFKKIFYLNRWLESKDYVAVKSSVIAQLTLTSVNLFKKIDFFKLRRRFLNIEKMLSLSSATQNMTIDWSLTKAYMPVGTESGNIIINLKGREPEGIVAPEDYERIRADLKKQLEAIKDPENGQPVIKRIYYRQELSSDDSAFTPDLLVEPEGGYYFNRGLEGSKLFFVPQFGKENKGCHRKEGIYVLSGPAFRHLENGPEAGIVDLPATILALMGIEPPSYFDGKVMNFAFQEHITKKQLMHLGEMEPKEQRQESYSQEDEAILQQRLKDLGYL